jgi:anti-sigma factor RsiW
MSDHPSIEQLSAHIDGELSLVAREAVSRHLRDCPTCSARHEELVDVAAALATVPAELWSQEMTEQAVRAAGEPAPPQRPTRSTDWSLPVATMLAVTGLATLAFIGPLSFSSLADSLSMNPFAAVAQGTGLPLAAFLAVLVLLPPLGLLAVPLLRQR